MPEDKEAFYYKVKIRCSHCNTINEVPYADFKSAMLSNHFYKLLCQKENCSKRTLVMYSFMALPYEYGDVPEKTLSKIMIPIEEKKEKKEPEVIQ